MPHISLAMKATHWCNWGWYRRRQSPNIQKVTQEYTDTENLYITTLDIVRHLRYSFTFIIQI